MNKYIFALAFAVCLLTRAKAQLVVKAHVLPYDDYYKIRGGANNFLYAAVKQKKATVAFLGGSITFNPGWRDMITTYLKERFPDTKFRFITAAIPSLGSLPHAFRLKHDLLDSGRIDLMFMEAAVNDRVNGTDSLTQVRDLEGIVRHAKRVNPLLDIIMMSFADPDKNSDYAKDKTPAEVANHELVARYYDLPSVNMAKEVYDKISNNEFSWEKDFKDLHPSPFGQELYFETIKSLMEKLERQQLVPPNAKKLPGMLDKWSFTNGDYQGIITANHDSQWVLNSKWVPADGLGTRPGFVNVPMLIADKSGAELTLSFKGKAIGMGIVSGGDAGVVLYSIDNGPFKEIDLFTAWSGSLHLPWYVLFNGKLNKGIHRLRLKIADQHHLNSKGNACRIVCFFRNE